MTWRTPDGDRVINGAEARLIAAALATMIDMANDSDMGLAYGMPLIQAPFQRLSDAQKYTVLEGVANALFKPTVTCPKLTAVNESAIYYVFAWLMREFEDDIETAEEVWGPKVLDALPGDDKESHSEDEDEQQEEDPDSIHPRMGCLDSSKWCDAIEALADGILWDRDFEMDMDFDYGDNAADGSDVESDYFEPYDGTVDRASKGRLYDLVRRLSDA